MVAAGRRIEGRKGFTVTHPEAVAVAKRLRRASPKRGERCSLRDISALRSIKAMLES